VDEISKDTKIQLDNAASALTIASRGTDLSKVAPDWLKASSITAESLLPKSVLSVGSMLGTLQTETTLSKYLSNQMLAQDYLKPFGSMKSIYENNPASLVSSYLIGDSAHSVVGLLKPYEGIGSILHKIPNALSTIAIEPTTPKWWENATKPLSYLTPSTSLRWDAATVAKVDSLSQSILSLSVLQQPLLDRISSQTQFDRVQKNYFANHLTRSTDLLRIGSSDVGFASTISSSLVTTGKFYDSLTDDPRVRFEAKENADLDPAVISSLRSLNPKYVNLLLGAQESLTGSNPDKVRHVLTSLRELSTFVLHDLSPSAGFKAWNQVPSYIVDGRPTRQGRLAYIFRNYKSTKIKAFIDNDIKLIKELFDLLNGGTHSLESTLSQDELVLLMRKTESTILLLLNAK